MKLTEKQRQPPRNYFSRREQLRLFVLVMSLGLVIVLMVEASNPDNWAWLFEMGENVQTAEQRSEDLNIDTAYQPTLTEEDTETMRIVPSFTLEHDDSQRYFPGVVPAYLHRVTDRSTLKHHPDEAAAWYNLWTVLATNDSHLINEASTGPVTFSELHEQPASFRGELVSIKGTVKQARWEEAPKNNEAKIDGYHRLILRLDSGPQRPVFLYVMDLPDTFPTGDKLNEQIEATAFFYKSRLYSASDRAWLAPTLLARDVKWFPGPVVAKIRLSSPVLLSGLVVIATLAIFFAWRVYTSTKRLFPFTDRPSKRRPDVDPITELKNMPPAPTIGEQLQDLAAKD